MHGPASELATMRACIDTYLARHGRSPLNA